MGSFRGVASIKHEDLNLSSDSGVTKIPARVWDTLQVMRVNDNETVSIVSIEEMTRFGPVYGVLPTGSPLQPWFQPIVSYPVALKTHVLRLLGPKTLLYRVFGLF